MLLRTLSLFLALSVIPSASLSDGDNAFPSVAECLDGTQSLPDFFRPRLQLQCLELGVSFCVSSENSLECLEENIAGAQATRKALVAKLPSEIQGRESEEWRYAIELKEVKGQIAFAESDDCDIDLPN